MVYIRPSQPKTVNQCQALKANGYPCSNRAVTVVPWRDEEIHLCTHHVNWRPDTHTGRTFRNRKMTKRDKEKATQRQKKSTERCCFPNKQGEVCQAPVTRRDEAQQPFCYYHYRQLTTATAEQRAILEQRIVEAQLMTAVGAPIDDEEHVKAGKRKLVSDMPDLDEQVAKLSQYGPAEQVSQGAHGIAFREKKIRGKTMGKSQFLGIDIEHYTPEFKYDYLYLLFNQIRRAEAVVIVLHEQLMKIELEEDEMKVTETSGTMMGENGPVEFSNKTIRHVTPMETKLNLVDKLTKQEAHLAKLMKDLEQLPMTCLTVFRKMGVKWDRKAAMMVVDAIEQEKMKTVDGYTQVDVNALPSKLEDAQRIVVKAAEQYQIPAPRLNAVEKLKW